HRINVKEIAVAFVGCEVDRLSIRRNTAEIIAYRSVAGELFDRCSVRLHPIELRILIAARSHSENDAAAVAEPSDKADVVVKIRKLDRFFMAFGIDAPNLARAGSVRKIRDRFSVRRKARGRRRP